MNRLNFSLLHTSRLNSELRNRFMILAVLAWVFGLSACQDFRANPTEGYSDLGLTQPPHQEKPRSQQAYDRLFVVETNDKSTFFEMGKTGKLTVTIRFLQPVSDAKVKLTVASMGLSTAMTRQPSQSGDSPNVFRFATDLKFDIDTLNSTETDVGPTDLTQPMSFQTYKIEITDVKSPDLAVATLFQSVVTEHESAAVLVHANTIKGVQK